MSARPLIEVLHSGGADDWSPIELIIPFGGEQRVVAACTHQLLPGLALHYQPISGGAESPETLTFSHVSSGRRVVTCDMAVLCDEVMCLQLINILIDAGDWTRTTTEIVADRQLEERLARGADAARQLVGDFVRVAPSYTLNEAVRGVRA